MSTPTPRTDAALLSSDCAYNCGHSFKLLILEKYDRGQCVYTGPDIAHGNDGVVVLAEFARALERELTAERARLRGLAAAQREIDQCIKEARAACQPYGPRQSRKLVWWRGKFDGLVAASAMLTLANFPNQPENARQIDAAIKEGEK
jgi:hypothetical protein